MGFRIDDVMVVHHPAPDGRNAITGESSAGSVLP